MAIIKTSFTLRLNLIDHAKIKKIAESQNRSMTNMIETLVKEKIKEYEKENGEIELTDEDIIGVAVGLFQSSHLLRVTDFDPSGFKVSP